MRLPRIKPEGLSFYHCISRAVDGLFIFRTDSHGSLEAEKFLLMMRRLAAFCCIRVLNYSLMSNHFHLLCEVPEPRVLSEAEILERVEAGHGSGRRQALEQRIARLRQKPDGADQIQRLLERYRKRMFDISIFLKELKGGFAQWYNRRHKRYGVLWAERFKSLLVEGGTALAAVAAYIDLNPVRVGLCTDPKDYRYCGYAEAVAKGSGLACEGIRAALGKPETATWEEVGREYRRYLFVRGSQGTESKPPAFDLATAQAVVDEQNGELSLPEHLRCTIRYFTDGVILGSQAFVESHFDKFKEKLGYKRQRRATQITVLGTSDPLWAFRKMRVRATG
ncbi:MAG TPA: transposase [Chthoniobacterales bacterium]|nr:transposase [Chthoniobacterales bacterium]